MRTVFPAEVTGTIVTADTFYPPGYGGEYKVSGFFRQKKGRWNPIFMISARYAFSFAGMLFAISEAVKNIGQEVVAAMQDSRSIAVMIR